MKKILLSLILPITFYLIAQAHGDLEKVPRENLIEIQKKLVKEKYLEEGTFKYGEVTIKVEDAYDKYIIMQQVKKFKEKHSEMASNTIENSENKKSNDNPKTFWSWIINFLTNLF